MAERIRGITVELNGDTSGLTKALKSTNTEIKSTQQQLKDVEKLLKLDPNNTELLRQKQKLLGDVVKENKEKLTALHQAEKQLKDNGVDENSAQFMALRREIIATENAVQSYGTETEKATNKAEKSGISAKTIWAAVAAAVIAAGKAMAETVVESAAAADEILTLSSVTGMSTQQIQELAYAAELVDVSLDTLSSTMRRNIRSMSSAQDGTEAAVEAYAALGVAVTNTDGTLRDSDEVYWETLDALAQVANETERDALAMEIFGKSAQDLNPLIDAGSEKLKELAKEAANTGYVMNEDTLAAFGSFDDAIQRLKNGATGAKNALAAVALPYIQQFVEGGTGMLGEFVGAINDADGDIVTALLNIFEVMNAKLPIITEKLTDFVFKAVDSIAEKLPDLLPQIVDTIVKLTEQISNPKFMIRITGAVLQLVWAVIKGVFKSLPELLLSGLTLGNSTGQFSNVEWFANGGTLSNGGAAIVGEAGPELLTNVNGQSVVTPLTKASAPVVAAAGNTAITNTIQIEFTGSLSQLAQVLQPYIAAESHRVGAI